MFFKCKMKALLVCFVLGLLCFDMINFTLASDVALKLELDTKNEIVIFVNSSGSDTPDCGSRIELCKTMKYALERVAQSNKTSGLINVLPGVYLSETAKVDCTVGNLRSVIIRGLGENVKIGLSADIVKCDVIFTNLHWTNSTKSALINAIISSLTIINSTMSEVGFSLLSSGSNIELISCVITKCSGWQPLFPIISASGITGFNTKLRIQNSNFSYNQAPLLSAKVVTLVTIQKCYFLSNVVNKGEVLITLAGIQGFVDDTTFAMNTGGNIKISEGSIVNITKAVFNSNNVLDGTLLDVGQGVSLRAVGCWFIKSYGMSKGPVLRTSNSADTANFMSCYFSCNQVNGSVNVSPIKNDASSSLMNCTNCTTDHHCPVFCGSGKYLMDSIMCLSCPIGTYSPGNGYNITTFACKKCDPGYYNSKAGSSSCMPCKPGSFAAKSGATMCTKCKNDFMTSNEGESSCSQLTVGFTVLSVCVVLLILFPLVVLLIQYLQTTNQWNPSKQKRFSRLYDTASQT